MRIAKEIREDGIRRWMVAPRCPRGLDALVACCLDRPWHRLTWLTQRRLKKSARQMFWPAVAAVVQTLEAKDVPRARSVEGMHGWAITTRPAYVSPTRRRTR